jgi:hypothetical protein
VSDIDWKAIAQTMAADNARLCDRLITAEAVVKALSDRLHCVSPSRTREFLEDLIAKHDAGRAS